MLMIDGSQGEGGGQVLRTSLSLAALTGRSFTLINYPRQPQADQGLRPQHLTAVRAADCCLWRHRTRATPCDWHRQH